MSITIRKAITSDMSSVLELIKELATFELEPDAVIVTEANLIRDGFGENPLFYCFVAELNQEIIGMALYYYRYSTWKGKTIHLEDLIVKQAHRGTGAGSLLYQKVLQQGLLENVQRMEWAVLDWNIHAIDFYKKSGANVLENWFTVHITPDAITNYLNKNETPM
jgi:GNAT superfamily N-acetyltransferase